MRILLIFILLIQSIPVIPIFAQAPQKAQQSCCCQSAYCGCSTEQKSGMHCQMSAHCQTEAVTEKKEKPSGVFFEAMGCGLHSEQAASPVYGKELYFFDSLSKLKTPDSKTFTPSSLLVLLPSIPKSIQHPPELI